MGRERLLLHTKVRHVTRYCQRLCRDEWIRDVSGLDRFVTELSCISRGRHHLSSGEEPPVSLTDKAIEQIRELIRSGALPPGSRLPPEPDLAAQLGLSRNLAREAVKALAVARVLEVRRGDGTYVTSLQ